MNKIMIPALISFALLSGCCLRVGESTRFGVNCCTTKDSQNFVMDETNEDDAAVATAQPISAKTYNTETIVGLGLAAALIAFLGWSSYKQLKSKCHSDTGEKQV